MVCRLKSKHERKIQYSLVCQIRRPPPPNIAIFFSMQHKLFNIFVRIFMREGGLSKQRETTCAAYTEVWDSAELSNSPRIFLDLIIRVYFTDDYRWKFAALLFGILVFGVVLRLRKLQLVELQVRACLLHVRRWHILVLFLCGQVATTFIHPRCKNPLITTDISTCRFY